MKCQRYLLGCVIGLLILGWTSTVQGAGSVDLLLLRDVVCNKETRTSAKPAWALSPDKLDWGECQIRITTAEQFGIGKDIDPGMMFGDGSFNRWLALRILEKCRDKWKRPSAYLTAYCYHGGKNRRVYKGSVWDTYAKEIESEYNQRQVAAR